MPKSDRKILAEDGTKEQRVLSTSIHRNWAVQSSSIPELAHEPDLIAAIQRDISTVGLVGEKDAGLLKYIADSSRKLTRPISLIFKGPSGSGKDKIQRAPTLLMPPEDVLNLMSLTPQALYYGPPDWLSHKILLGGERSHQDDDIQRDRTAAVRQMLSHGFLTKMTVNEKRQSVEIRQDGPISYSETTTRDSIFKEDANRCLQVTTNASSKLTRDVLRATSKRYRPGTDSADEEAEKARKKHHEFQRSLEYVDVRIPYAERLAEKMPTDQIEIRRVFGQVLSLIEAIAFIHQFHRPKNAHGQLEATADDYRLARRLILGPLHTTLGLGGEYLDFKRLIARLPKGEFDTNEALAAAFESRTTCKRKLQELEQHGLLRCISEGGACKPARWQWTGKKFDDLVLPSPEAVFT